MLLYTDGLVERRDEDLDAGAARLLGALRETKHLPLAELADTLVLRMRPTDGYRDDVAVLAARTPGTRDDLFVDVHAAAPGRAPAGAGAPARVAARPASGADGRRRRRARGRRGVGQRCEHGSNFDERACITVEASVHHGVLRAAVSDHGGWTTNSAVSTQDGRGRGFAIMHRTMDAIEVRRGPLGTTVSLRRDLRVG